MVLMNYVKFFQLLYESYQKTNLVLLFRNGKEVRLLSLPDIF